MMVNARYSFNKCQHCQKLSIHHFKFFFMILFSHYHHSLIEPSQFFHHRQYLMNLNSIHRKIFSRKLATRSLSLHDAIGKR